MVLLLGSELLILNLERPENFFRKGFDVAGDLELVCCLWSSASFSSRNGSNVFSLPTTGFSSMVVFVLGESIERDSQAASASGVSSVSSSSSASAPVTDILSSVRSSSSSLMLISLCCSLTVWLERLFSSSWLVKLSLLLAREAAPVPYAVEADSVFVLDKAYNHFLCHLLIIHHTCISITGRRPKIAIM